MELLLAVAGIILSLGVAYWQYRDAQKAKAELSMYLRRLPDQLLNNIAGFLKGQQGAALELFDVQESSAAFFTRIADVDGDGKDELLVQHGFGAHCTNLKIFGIKDQEFQLLAETDVDTMAGFLVEDLDHDGKLEIKTLVVSPAADLPYVCGFRDEVWFRLESGELVEVLRRPLYTRADLKNFKKHESED